MIMNVFNFLCCLLTVNFICTEIVLGEVEEDVSRDILPLAPEAVTYLRCKQPVSLQDIYENGKAKVDLNKLEAFFNIALDLPLIAEDLEPFCNDFNKILEFLRICDSEYYTLEQLDRWSNFTKEACSDGTYLHNAIMESYTCFNARPLNEEIPCSFTNISDERMKKSVEALQNHGIPELALDSKFSSDCMYIMYDYVCLAEYSLETCKITAKYAFTEVVKSLLYPRDMCKAEVLDDLPKIIEVLKSFVIEQMKQI